MERMCECQVRLIRPESLRRCSTRRLRRRYERNPDAQRWARAKRPRGQGHRVTVKTGNGLFERRSLEEPSRLHQHRWWWMPRPWWVHRRLHCYRQSQRALTVVSLPPPDPGRSMYSTEVVSRNGLLIRRSSSRCAHPRSTAQFRHTAMEAVLFFPAQLLDQLPDYLTRFQEKRAATHRLRESGRGHTRRVVSIIPKLRCNP